MPSGVYKRTAKHRAALSAGQINRHADPVKHQAFIDGCNIPERKANLIAVLNTPGAIENMRAAHNCLEIKEKKRAVTTKLWQTSEYVSKQMIARHVSPNKVELLFDEILSVLFPGEWEFKGDGKDPDYIVGGKSPDFFHTSKKLIIELFGDYWHGESEIEPRTKLFESFGYRTLIVWTSELEDVDSLKEKIFEFEKRILNHD